jgi:uncharacterized protein (DUF488 family)
VRVIVRGRGWYHREVEQPNATLTILTVGHSNQPVEHLVALLRQHAVDVLVDVRSQPYSRYATQFNREHLEPAVVQYGLHYLFLGAELGGRQLGKIPSLDERLILADEVIGLPSFQHAIDRLLEGARRYRIALLCAEEDPTECHRRLWVGRALRMRGATVAHIRSDGRLDADDALKRLKPPAGEQISLFEE